MKPGSIMMDGQEWTIEDQVKNSRELAKQYAKKAQRARRTAATLLESAEQHEKQVERLNAKITELRRKYNV